MLPIPFFAFRTIYDEIAREDWADVGPLPAFELVDVGLVLSALGHPFATIGGRDAYPTIRGKAAALFRGLVKNHGLQDGNKRLAVTVMSTFLLLKRLASRILEPPALPIRPPGGAVRRELPDRVDCALDPA